MTIRIVWRMQNGRLVAVRSGLVKFDMPDAVVAGYHNRQAYGAAEPKRVPISLTKISLQSSENGKPLPLPHIDRKHSRDYSPADLAKEAAKDRIRRIHARMKREGKVVEW
jgi:hypothetical protein